MDAEVAKQVLTSARERHDRIVKWTGLALVLVALFHVVVFMRFVGARQREREMKVELAVLTERGAELAGVVEAMGVLNAAVGDWISREVEGTLDAIRADFVDLGQVLEEARRGDFGRVGAAEPGSDRFTGQIPNMPMSTQGNLSGRRWTLTPEVVEAARAGRDTSDPALITPVVDREIIGPRFESMNESWQGNVVGPVAETGEELDAAFTRLAAEDRPGAADWTRASESVRAFVAAARATRFTPPSQPMWWGTVASKGETMRGMGGDVRAAVTQTLSSMKLESLRDTLEAQTKGKRAEIASVEKRIAEIKKGFEDQAAVIGGLGGPVRFLVNDLEYLVPRFPLLLGVLLMACASRTAAALRDLLRAALAVGGPETAATLARVLAPDGRASWGTFALRLAGSAAWIGAAGWMLRGWDEADGVRVFVVVGLVFVCCGEGYRLWVMRNLPGELTV